MFVAPESKRLRFNRVLVDGGRSVTASFFIEITSIIMGFCAIEANVTNLSTYGFVSKRSACLRSRYHHSMSGNSDRSESNTPQPQNALTVFQ